jgi:hypothetical protein
MKQLIKESEANIQAKVTSIENKLTELEGKEAREGKDPLSLMHEELQQVERRSNLVVHGLQEAAEGQGDGDLVGDLLEQVVQGGSPDLQVYGTGKSGQNHCG